MENRLPREPEVRLDPNVRDEAALYVTVYRFHVDLQHRLEFLSGEHFGAFTRTRIQLPNTKRRQNKHHAGQHCVPLVRSRGSKETDKLPLRQIVQPGLPAVEWPEMASVEEVL